MNRFYAAEPTPTITGSNADHRIAVAARDILPLAQTIAAELGIGVAAPGMWKTQIGSQRSCTISMQIAARAL